MLNLLFARLTVSSVGLMKVRVTASSCYEPYYWTGSPNAFFSRVFCRRLWTNERTEEVAGACKTVMRVVICQRKIHDCVNRSWTEAEQVRVHWMRLHTTQCRHHLDNCCGFGWQPRGDVSSRCKGFLSPFCASEILFRALKQQQVARLLVARDRIAAASCE